MSEDKDNRINQNFNSEEESYDDIFSDFDLAKFLVVTTKSIVWVVLLLAVSLTGSYLYIRYTKPVFQSSAILKLDLKTEAGVLGFKDFKENQTHSKLSNLSGEIELIKSKLIYEKVIENLDLNVSYYAYGSILFEERYGSSPFVVEYAIKNPAIQDKKFDLKIISQKEFLLSYELNEKEYSNRFSFGEIINNGDFIFKIHLTDFYLPEFNGGVYFFKINSKEALLNYVARELEVGILNLDANTIEIFFKDHDKYKAKDIVEAVCKVYLTQTVENKSKAQEQTIRFLDETLESTEAKLVQSEIQLESFIRRNKTVNVKEDVSRLVGKLEELDIEKFELKANISLLNDLKGLIVENKELKVFLPSLASIADPQLITSITNLNILQQEKDLAMASSKENTFIIKSKNIAIENLKSSILDLITQNKKIILEQINEINKKMGELEKAFLTLPSKETEYTRLKRFYDIYEKYYLLLMEKKAEFGIAKAGNVPNFVILSPATVNYLPIYPKALLIYLTGGAIGLFLGISLIFVRYFLHNTIATQKELETAVKAPVLGGIPSYSKEKMEFSRLVVSKSPKSAISESLRSIRTNLDFICPNKSKKIISVTSTISGEGKTFVTSNLAGVIAMSNYKVIILDLDMRKPKLHLAFDGQNAKGMSTLLIGRHTLDECIQYSELENLDYISAGPIPPNPSELIMRKDLDVLLEQLHKVYDVIIVDTPPVGLVTDGILIMKKADIALYVVRANYTKKGVKRNINKLINTTGLDNICVVINALTNINTYGYGAYGTYGSNGYGYYDEEQEKKSIFSKWKKTFSG